MKVTMKCLSVLLLALCMLVAGCGGNNSTPTPAQQDSTTSAAANDRTTATTAAESDDGETTEQATSAQAAETTTTAKSNDSETTAPAASGELKFNPTGFPIMSEPITYTAFWEGGTNIDWDANEFIKKYGELTNIYFDIQPSPDGGDGLQRRNILFASGDYPDVFLMNWQTLITKADTMQFGVREGIIIPVTSFVEDYGVNMKRVFDYNPMYRETATAPDGEIYGLPRFSECYHCGAYPKIYVRQDWLDTLGLQMPTTTEEFRSVLEAFITQDPNGNGQADEIGLTGAITWNTMAEYAIMGMAFQTVKPDFWLSYDRDGSSVEVSTTTEHYREGLRYIKSLFDEGLIDRAAFTQRDDQMAQTVRTDPHIAGAYTCDHPGMGYDTANVEEAMNYQILLPIEGPDGFRRQGDNANEGEVRGYHAVITDKAQFPEAAYRYFDEILIDDEINMERFYGPRGTGWDYAPAGTKDIFGGDAKYVILESDREKILETWGFGNGPSADLAPFRISMLPEVDNIYLPENYEQRITIDSRPLYEFKPDKRLQYDIFVPLEMSSEYSEIQANLNSFFRMATVQFIIGDRDIETGWEQYLSEAQAYSIDRYVEIYKIATGMN